MAITKASGNSVTAAAKGDLVVGNATNDSGVLAVGSTDQVLTVDSSTATGLKWATPAAGGMTLISTTTLSGTSVTLSSIPSTYKNLAIVITGVTNNTGSQTLNIRPNSSSTLAFYTTIDNNNNTLVTQRYTNDSIINNTSYLNTGGVNTFNLSIQNYANTTNWKSFNYTGGFIIISGTSTYSFNSGGVIKTTSAISSLQITSDNGYTFTAGTVLLYGVN